MAENVKPGKYRHYKGNSYQVLGIATHSETLEPMVVYRALYGERGVWVRPAAMWNELVEVEGRQVRRFTRIGEETDGGVDHLWRDGSQAQWDDALRHYDDSYDNVSIEQYMKELDRQTVERMSPQEFYDFLYNKYFVWKYTAANRLAATRKQLSRHSSPEGLSELGNIHRAIFRTNREDAAAMLAVAAQIHGLGTAGASGLLSILFPEDFGTVDQFVVLALQSVEGLPEHGRLQRVNPQSITVQDGAVLESILRRKAAELNRKFDTGSWTPRKIDMVLWAYGR